MHTDLRNLLQEHFSIVYAVWCRRLPFFEQRVFFCQEN